MKLKDLRELQRHVEIVTAAERIDQEDIKGLSVQVIFEGSRTDVPQVQIFVAESDPAYSKIMDVIKDRVRAQASDSQSRISDVKAKFAAS